MKAAYITSTAPGQPIEVGDLPAPTPAPGQILVRVGAVSLNPIDLYLRSGAVVMPMAFPQVVGCDFAGTVEATGAGVSRFRAGDRVWGSNQGLMGRPGAASELAAIDEEWAYPTPSSLDDEAAAALPLVGITAHLGLFRCAHLKRGETVYVPGGGGGVGSMVVQLAKAAGARVATSAGHESTLQLCRDLGADLVINYKEEHVPERLRAWSESGIDVWYETRREPDLEETFPLLRKRGRLVLMAGRAARPVFPVGSFYPRDLSVHGFAMFNANAQEQRVAADDLIRWVDAGLLRPRVGKLFTLDQAAQAFDFLEANTVGGAGTLAGKVVIQIN